MKFKLKTKGLFYAYLPYIKTLKKLGFKFREVEKISADYFLAIWDLKRETKVYEIEPGPIEIEINTLEELVKLRGKLGQNLIFQGQNGILIDD
jgi:hypothetical protein